MRNMRAKGREFRYGVPAPDISAFCANVRHDSEFTPVLACDHLSNLSIVGNARSQTAGIAGAFWLTSVTGTVGVLVSRAGIVCCLAT